VSAAVSEDIRQRAAQIRLLVLDVDGVLTDGCLYYGSEGETLKVFHVRDGAGIVALRKFGIVVAVISGRNSAMVERRMRELGVNYVKQGISDKQLALQELLQELNLAPQAVACVGDDIPDLPMFELAHLNVAVSDAHHQVCTAAHWITQLPGGRGAVREVCDLILSQQGAPLSKVGHQP